LRRGAPFPAVTNDTKRGAALRNGGDAFWPAAQQA
jgi:hypothetical protein